MNLQTTFTTRIQKALPYILIICGVIGFLASFVLTTEKFQQIQDASYVPPCNINSLLSCGSVMKTEQASVFGFANSLLGIAGFTVVTTVGFAMLAGAKFKRWFWLGLNAGLLLAVIFVHWLAFEAIYEIQALCIWCMVVWVVSIASLWYVTIHNLETEVIPVYGRTKGIVSFLQRNHVTLLVLWYLVILAAILQHFWPRITGV